jgi:hypothetical protein
MQEQAVPAVAPAAEPAPPASDAIVESWFQDAFHNRAIETSEYNRIFAAKEDLKARLRDGAQ